MSDALIMKRWVRKDTAVYQMHDLQCIYKACTRGHYVIIFLIFATFPLWKYKYCVLGCRLQLCLESVVVPPLHGPDVASGAHLRGGHHPIAQVAQLVEGLGGLQLDSSMAVLDAIDPPEVGAGQGLLHVVGQLTQEGDGGVGGPHVLHGHQEVAGEEVVAQAEKKKKKHQERL